MQPQIIVVGTQNIQNHQSHVLVIFHENMVIRADLHRGTLRHHCQVERTLAAIIIFGSHFVYSIQDVYKKAINQDFIMVDSISLILEV